MAFVRAVEFEGVSGERIEEIRQEISDGEPPENLPAKEIAILHDAAQERALVLVFFDSEEDYEKGDQVLNEMPGEETPGRRTGVTKYEVAGRMTL